MRCIDSEKMDNYDKQVWVKHRELEIACWEEHIAHNNLSDDDKTLFLKAIEENRVKLKEV
jgi:hypothetical protein